MLRIGTCKRFRDSMASMTFTRNWHSSMRQMICWLRCRPGFLTNIWLPHSALTLRLCCTRPAGANA
jgi:hypothetical protein